MPRGFTAPEEARLGDTEGLLSPEHRDIVTSWWLAVRARANTPNWDIASTASIDGTQGLVLIEAKAHAAELKRAGHGIRNEQNLAQIRGAVEEANAALEEITQAGACRATRTTSSPTVSPGLGRWRPSAFLSCSCTSAS